MKRIFTVLLIVMLSATKSFSQCTPDTITDPGIYPDTLVNLAPAFEGAPYASVIQLRVLHDTTGAIGTVIVDSIILNSVIGLPSGFTYACNPSWCAWKADHNGCILLSGTPAIGSAGDYLLTINTTLKGKLFGLIPFSQAGTVDGYRIKIYPKPVANFSAAATSVCKNDSVQFFDNSTNNPTAWNWTFTGASPSTSTLQNPKVKFTATGNKNVTLVASNPAGNNTNVKSGYITVNGRPTAVVSLTGNDTICQGDTAKLAANSGVGFTYQWLLNGVAISGATNQNYNATATGNYTVQVTNTSGCATTSVAKKIKVLTVSATITPGGPTTFCAGGSVTLQANTGVDLTYKWLKNNVIIPGATASIYVATTAGTYKVKVTRSGVCSRQSTGVKVKVNCKTTNTVAVKNEYVVYPNPASDNISLNMYLPSSQDLKISVYDLTGRMISTVADKNFSEGNAQMQVDVSNLENGLYFIQFESIDSKEVVRFSVQHKE